MTAPTVSQARSWAPAVLARQADEWRRAGGVLDRDLGVFARAAASTREHWGGVAADAARARADEVLALGTRTASVLHAAASAADGAADALDLARAAVLAAVDAARSEGFDVGDDGAVAVSPALVPTFVQSGIGGVVARAVLEHRAGQHRSVIRSALGELGAADGRARSLIDSAFAELPRDGDPGTGWVGVQTVPLAPSAGASPADNRAWWDSLTPPQRQVLLETSPDMVGDRDGLPAEARHLANLARLPAERAALESARQVLMDRASTLSGFAAQAARHELAGVTGRLADLDAVERAVLGHPDRRLLLLDARSGEQVRAAVAVGDPDTADHIAVTVPGMNAGVRASLGSMADEAAALRQEALAQLRARPGRGHETVAAVAWIGYDPPRTSGSVVDAARGGLAVAQRDRASVGACDLARFYDGLGVAHTGSDPHITAIGHSYGSVTTGLALREPGRRPVDDVVVYGSPGLVDVRSPADLGLGPGHAYEMTADGDVIARLNRFGPGPLGGGPYATDGFTHLGTDAADTPDGVRRDGAVGHSEYPRVGDDGRLRTSGYNLAVVVAGLPERAVGVPGSSDGTD
ncbi:alpha/beta hydrolase [Prescottella agglutinans]|uniref:alpha/beta hydrolase n=1 Tax=Prescottella agglutinans TaxID=1644129 RepID=UPI003D971193